MNDFGKMKNSTLVHDYRFESQLCVPQDPIGELEWYPTLDDYSINLDDLWCFCPLDDKDYNGKRMRDERDHALACKKQKIEHDGTEGLKEDWRDESGGDGGKKRRCSHCLAESTPQWRAGPKGPKTLCNACGLRYRSGRLVPEYRPAASPTFDKAKHSNFHKKLLKLGLSE